MKLSVKLLFLMLSLVLITTSQAQLTEQSENECYEGGMLEGQCSTTDVNGDGVVDQQDIDWMFACGYYMADVDNNELENENIPLDGCEKQERTIPRPHIEKEKVKEEKCSSGSPVRVIGCPS